MEWRLLVLMSFIGGVWIFALRYHGGNTYLIAPPIYGNIKPGLSPRITENKLIQSRKRDTKTHSISRHGLSFCNHKRNAESTGEEIR